MAMPQPPAGAPAGPAADPAMAAAPGGPAPGMEAPEPDEDDGSYEICIQVSGDGALAVGVKKGMEGEVAYKPAENIKDALTKALEIFRADGKSEAADDAFNAGFTGMTQQQGA